MRTANKNWNNGTITEIEPKEWLSKKILDKLRKKNGVIIITKTKK